jgi:hypothetical protein
MKYDGFVEVCNHIDLAFVARAVSDDDDHPQFWYMKIEKKDDGLLATATDGKRLHLALIKESVDGPCPGYWRVLKNKMVEERDCELECDLERMGCWSRRVYRRKSILWLAKLDAFDLFPSEEVINRIIPQEEPIKEGVIHTGNCNFTDMNALIKNLQDTTGINLRYLKDLGPHEWTCKIYPPEKPVLFESGHKVAIIGTIRDISIWPEIRREQMR